MKIDAGVVTRRNKRACNEDNFLCKGKYQDIGSEKDSTIIQSIGKVPDLYAVFDGMGGMNWGEIASYLSARLLAAEKAKLLYMKPDQIMEQLDRILLKINNGIYEYSKRKGQLGCTAALLYVTEDKVYITNVGDSKIFCIRKGKIKKLTKDHNLAQEMFDAGLITQEELNHHKKRHILTQYLGISPQEMIIEPYHYVMENCSGETTFLLCTDGVTERLPEQKILEIITTQRRAGKAARGLVDEAESAGAKDNLTAMVVKINRKRGKMGEEMDREFDIHSLEPLWGSWYIDSLIGEGSFGSVYRIVREEFGKKYYSALKMLFIPKNVSEEKQAFAEGMDWNTATIYFKDIAEDIYKEIVLMSELKGRTNIVNCEDHQVIQKPDGVGFIILIRMELLTSLNDYLLNKQFTNKDIVNLGMDICQALMLCKKRNIIHRDIKPANIFVSSDGDYKLGDFGIARQMEGAEQGLSIKGSFEYMAPEVYLGKKYDERVDIYSLGMVLYYFLNNRRAPFISNVTQVVRHGERQAALRRRFSGEELPDPILAGKKLAAVVKKACAFNMEDRYQSAEEFLNELSALSEEDKKLVCPKGIVINNTVTFTNSASVGAGSFEKQTKEQEGMLLKESERKEKDTEGRKEEEEEKEIKESKENGIKEELIKEELEEEEDPISKNNQDMEATVLLERTSVSVQNMMKQKEEEEPEYEEEEERNKLVPVCIAAGVVLVLSLAVVLVSVVTHRKKDQNIAAIVTVTPAITEVAEVTIAPEVTEEPIVTKPVPTEAVVTKVPETEQPEKITPTPVITEVLEQVEEYAVDMNAENLSGLADITDLEKVTNLTACGLQITDIMPLSASAHLNYLDMQDNALTDLSVLADKKELTCLNVMNNQVTDISSLSGLQKLEVLVLAENPISDIRALENLTSLTELRLDGDSEITDFSVLGKLENLFSLNLERTVIDDITPLTNLKKLGLLVVTGTKLDENEIARLQEALPDCIIIN